MVFGKPCQVLFPNSALIIVGQLSKAETTVSLSISFSLLSLYYDGFWLWNLAEIQLINFGRFSFMFIRIKCFESGVRFMPILFKLSDSNSFRIPHMFIAWMASRRLILFGRRHSAVVFVSFLWDGNKLVLGFDQKRIPLPHFDCGIIQIVRYLNTF